MELGRTPLEWFTDAGEAGAAIDLEVRAIEAASGALSRWPGFLSVNVSPATLLDPRLVRALSGLALPRVVLELTEHAPVSDYSPLLRALAPLRAAGLRLAVDDCGAGYASLAHVLALAPDILKLDVALVRDVDTHPVRQALVRALLAFARATGAHVVAEGVETPAELSRLTDLGVDLAQGYLLGRPSAQLPLPLPARGGPSGRTTAASA